LRGWCRSGRSARCSCTIELLGDGGYLSRNRNLEIIAAPSQIYDIRIVSVSEHTRKEALAETLAVATEKLKGTTAECARRHRRIAANQ
jgi:hypothetical protein